MKRLAGSFRLAALIALGSLPGIAKADADWVQIAIDPARDVEVGWAEGEFTGDEVRFDKLEHAALVLTNRSTVPQSPSELAISSGDPSSLQMVTLTAVSGRTTHMTSVMNPTGFDVLSFDPGWVLDGGESVTVAVEATPAETE